MSLSKWIENKILKRFNAYLMQQDVDILPDISVDNVRARTFNHWGQSHDSYTANSKNVTLANLKL